MSTTRSDRPKIEYVRLLPGARTFCWECQVRIPGGSYFAQGMTPLRAMVGAVRTMRRDQANAVTLELRR